MAASPKTTSPVQYDTLNSSFVTRATTLAFIVLPGVLLLAAAFLGFSPNLIDVALMAILTFASIGAITLGNHRYFTHRSFETKPWLRNLLAVASSMAVQGNVINWVADHRKHHAFTDEPGDPHSPHVNFAGGFMGTLCGLWHAHVGWLVGDEQADPKRYAADLLKDRWIIRISQLFLVFATLSLVVVPFALGWLLTGGEWKGGLSAVFWAGLVRLGLAHHLAWIVNSACHMFGSRPFETDEKSTNCWWLALPTMGEAWHHNHHAFPRSARHGLNWRQLDPTYWIICTLERLGLVWDVVRVSPEKQTAKRTRA